MRRRDFNKFVGGKNHMKRREYYFNFIGVFLPILSVCFVACSQAANYPDKPVMIISGRRGRHRARRYCTLRCQRAC